MTTISPLSKVKETFQSFRIVSNESTGDKKCLSLLIDVLQQDLRDPFAKSKLAQQRVTSLREQINVNLRLVNQRVAELNENDAIRRFFHFYDTVIAITISFTSLHNSLSNWTTYLVNLRSDEIRSFRSSRMERNRLLIK